MICYRDMSFCIWSNVCQNKTCERNFNDQQRENAIKWWGNNSPPIMFSDLQTKDCGARL